MNRKTSIAEDIQHRSPNGISLMALVYRNYFMQPGKADLGSWERNEHPQLFCPAPAQHHRSGTYASLTGSSNLDAIHATHRYHLFGSMPGRNSWHKTDFCV